MRNIKPNIEEQLDINKEINPLLKVKVSKTLQGPLWSMVYFAINFQLMSDKYSKYIQNGF